MKTCTKLFFSLALLTSLTTISVEAAPYASAVTNNAGTVSFRLNENADDVQVVLDNTTTNDLGAMALGTHSFSLGSANAYQIIVSKNAAAGWSQISSDANTLVQFLSPKGIAVNVNPTNGALFGRVYVANAISGANTVTGTRSTGDGIYILNSDLSDALGKGNTASTAGISWVTGTTSKQGPDSPYRIEVGPDNRLYIADYSTNKGTIWRTDPDVTTSQAVLAGLGITGAPTIHGTISGLSVTGTSEAGNLTVYGIDGDNTGSIVGAHTSGGSILRWDIGTNSLPYSNAPVAILTIGSLGVPHLVWDMDIGPDGKIYGDFYRLNNAVANVNVYDPANSYSVMWNSLTDGGNPDPLSGTQGIKVSPDGQYLAGINTSNQTYILHLTNGIPDMAGYYILPTFPNSPTSGTSQDIAWDAAGNLYVTSTNRQAMRVFSPGGQTIAVTGNDVNGTNGSFSITHPAFADPTIVVQPQSQTNITGSSVFFTVGVVGTTPFYYQWSTNGVEVPGANTNQFSISPVQISDNGTIVTVVITNVNGAVTSAPAMLVNNDVFPAFVNPPQNVTVTAGTNATLSTTAVGNPALAYTWRFNGAVISGQTTNSLIRTNVQTPTTVGYYSVTISNRLGAVTSSIVTITIQDSAPIITNQPVSVITNAGTNFTFTVGTIGTDPRAYQWSLNGTNVLGATTSSLARNNVQQGMAGNYQVTVSNYLGAVTSSIATLTVIDSAPTITVQPANRTNAANTSATLSVTTLGSDPRFYQWYLGQVSPVPITDATNSSLVLPNPQYSDSNYYSVVITNSFGSVTSSLALLSITNTPLAITVQPKPTTNGAGANVSFSVTAIGAPALSYFWYTNSVSAANLIASATTGTLTLTNVQTSDSGKNFLVVVSNATATVTSSTAALTVTNKAPTIIVQPVDFSGPMLGSATNVVVAQGQNPLSYQWRLNGTNVFGATNATLVLNGLQASSAGSYTVVVTDSAGSVTSSAALLSVVGAGAGAGTGNGVNGDYFANQFFGYFPTGPQSFVLTPTLSRIDPNIDTNWLAGAPDPSMPVDYFFVRWTGQIQPLYSETYTFYTKSDDGIKVWINGQLLIDHWISGGNQNYTAVVSNLVAGQKYDLRVEYMDITSTAEAHLLWSSASQVKQPVPTSQLYTSTGPYIISMQPTNIVASPGGSATFSAVAGGPGPLSYQWKFAGTNINGATTSSLTLNNVNVSNAGNYTVLVSNQYGSATNLATTTLQINSASGVAGSGNGLISDYYALGSTVQTLFTNYAQFTNLPTMTRTDAVVDFDWGTASPDPSFQVDNFAVRWYGKIQPQYSQVYTFYTLSDEGIRLWIDGQLIIDKWVTGTTNVNNYAAAMPYAFNANQLYDIRLEYYEGTGPSEAHLYWSSASQPKQIVPTTQLYPLTLPYITSLTPTNYIANSGDYIYTFTVNATGSDTLSYQWMFAGTNIAGATDSSLYLQNVQYSDAGLYSVIVSNIYGSTTNVMPAQLTVQIPVTYGNGNGVTGDYFSNALSSAASSATSSFTLTPSLTRQDPQIDFNWTTNSPDPNISSNNFLARWTGQVQPLTTDYYTFFTKSDDGARLWINGQLIIDRWVGQSVTEIASAPILLNSNQLYDLRMEYFEGSSTAEAHLSWANSLSLPKQLILSYQLYPNSGPYVIVQPTNVTANAGANVAITVAAGGTGPLSYQWQKNGSNIPGATDTALSLSNVQLADAGSYAVVITNSISNTVTYPYGYTVSTAAVLSVAVPPTISFQPQSVTTNVGQNVSFSVSGGGASPLSFQWYFNGTNVIAGATSATLNVNNVQTTNAGSYAVAISNPFGTAVSTAASLTVSSGSAPPPSFGGQSGISGNNFNLTWSTTSGRSYRLQYSADLKTWTTITDFVASGSTLSYSDTLGAGNKFYRIILLP